MKKSKMTELQLKGFAIERAVVETLTEKIDKMGRGHHKPISSIAFGGDGGKWRKIRNKAKNGKPQNLTLSDAIAMASALGEKLDRIIVEAEVSLDTQD